MELLLQDQQDYLYSKYVLITIEQVNCAGFLRNSFDDYWSGYRACHEPVIHYHHP